MENRNAKPPSAIVFWVIWFAILNGLFIILFFAAGGIPEGKNQGEAPLAFVAVAGLLILIAMSIRFFVIPKLDSYEKLLPAMIVGLALAESVGIIGMFVIGKEFPETQLALFVVSVSAVVTFAPFYVSGLAERKKMR
ncbi:MAG: hypothetical protein NWR51_10605 [Akkermansiaceae bacterium]|nr:hypothetical protein [Akkermansiaceae bacterium]MDP4847699.1 hypothetical protein [Akkermansiaceae bacterium]MDP4896603.1 hypothetical protein [Akkermansiaceae bacterium]MDP4994832.1 hypothetical protein [Akkermansiaceae bacterium]